MLFTQDCTVSWTLQHFLGCTRTVMKLSVWLLCDSEVGAVDIGKVSEIDAMVGFFFHCTGSCDKKTQKELWKREENEKIKENSVGPGVVVKLLHRGLFKQLCEVLYVVDCIDKDMFLCKWDRLINCMLLHIYTLIVSAPKQRRECELLRESQAMRICLKPVSALRHFECLETGYKPPHQCRTGCNPTQADNPTQSVPTDLVFFRNKTRIYQKGWFRIG